MVSLGAPELMPAELLLRILVEPIGKSWPHSLAMQKPGHEMLIQWRAQEYHLPWKYPCFL